MEMDPPTAGTHASERFAEQLARGELVPVEADTVEKVETIYGKDKDGKDLVGYHWVQKGAGDDDAPAAPADGSIDDVLDRVRGGPVESPATDGWEERALAALEAEQAKGPKARKRLVERLQTAIDEASRPVD